MVVITTVYFREGDAGPVHRFFYRHVLFDTAEHAQLCFHNDAARMRRIYYTPGCGDILIKRQAAGVDHLVHRQPLEPLEGDGGRAAGARRHDGEAGDANGRRDPLRQHRLRENQPAVPREVAGLALSQLGRG